MWKRGKRYVKKCLLTEEGPIVFVGNQEKLTSHAGAALKSPAPLYLVMNTKENSMNRLKLCKTVLQNVLHISEM